MDVHSESSNNTKDRQRSIVKEMAALREFKDIIHRKLRAISLCIGLDVLQPDFRPNIMTAFTVTSVLSSVVLVASMTFNAMDEMTLTASACLRLGLKVGSIAQLHAKKKTKLFYKSSSSFPDHRQVCVPAARSR